MFKKTVLIVIILSISVGCHSKTKEELLNAGVKQMTEGNVNGAIVFLKNALEKDPNYVEARLQLGRAYTAAGKYEQAERELQKVARLNPSLVDVKLYLAKVYTATGKADMAVSEATEYLKLHPGSAEALEVLGVAYAVGNNLDAAESNLLQALKAEPGRVSAKIALARIYAAGKRSGEARALLGEIIKADPNNSQGYQQLASLESSLGNQEEALRLLQKVMALQPNDVAAAFRVGILFLGKGETAKAAHIADDLNARFPKRAEGHALKGMVEYYGKNYDKAIVELQSSLQLRQSPGAYYFLGLCHYNRKELDLALSQFRKVVELQPGNVQPRLMIALVLLQQKHLDDALAEAKKAVEQNENFARAHSVLGSVYTAKGLYEEAMAEFNKATALDPQMSEAYLKKGLVKLGKGKTAEGETDLEVAVKVAPDVLSSRVLLVSYLMKQKKYPKALTVLKQGIRGGKEDAVYYNKMAVVAFAMNKKGDGFAYLQKAKQANPDFFPAYLNIASYHATQGDKDKAFAEYQALLQRDPRNTAAFLGLADVAAAKGDNGQVLNYLKKAKETKAPAGYLALAGYYKKNNDAKKTLGVLDEAIAAFPGNPAFLELKNQVYLSENKYRESAETLAAMEKITPERALALQVETYTRMKEPAKAVQAAQKLIATKPKSAAGYYVLAAIYGDQNKLPEANRAIQDGLRVEPGNVTMFMALGNIQFRMKEYDKAITAYDEATKKNPKFGAAYFAQGVVYELTGRKKEAAKKYQETLRRSANYVPALNNLALLFADGLGDRKEALNLAKKAYELSPKNPGVMETYGYVLHKNNKNGEAVKYLEKAATLLPKSPTTLYHLALVQRAMGDKAKAIGNLQKALEMGKFADADTARHMLAELKS